MSTNHPTPPEGWDAFNARKQHEGGIYSDDNTEPGSRGLTNEERELFTLGRAAVGILEKGFEAWMTIGRAVEAAHKRAEIIGGNRKKEAFERILREQGISVALGNTPASIRSTASRWLKIIEHELEVYAWHNGLTDPWEKLHWVSATAIYKHCHVFQRKAELDGEKARKEHKPTPTERIKTLEAENAHLTEELASTVMRYEGAPLPEPMWHDNEPGIEGLTDALNAWKPLRKVELTYSDMQQFVEVVQHDLDAMKEFLRDQTAPPETPAPAPKRKRRKAAKAAPAPATETPLVEPVEPGPDPLSSARRVPKATTDEAPAAISSMIEIASAAPTKNLVQRKRDVLARANAAGNYELAEQIDKDEISILAAEKALGLEVACS